MKNSILIAMMATSMLAVSCAKKSSKNASPPPPSATEKPKCATSTDTSLPNDNVLRQTVNLKKERQRVIRKNCTGQVVSDKIETVKDPNQYITIKSFKKFKGVHTSDLVWSLSNRMTCDGTSPRSSDLRWTTVKNDPVEYSFHVDASPSVFYLHVQKNEVNYINYRLRLSKLSTDINGASKLDYDLQEEGTLILTVNYSEEELPGVLEKSPTASECQKPR